MKTACIYHSIDLDGFMSAAIVKHWFKQEYKNYSYDCGKDFQRVENYDSRYAKLDFIGYNYGQPIPDLSEYDQVIMVDVSFPFEELKGKSVSRMFQLFQKLNANFIWIDHHISAIKDNIGLEYINDKGEDTSTLFNGLRNTKYAACELTWKYFFPNEPMPEIVRLLGMYDSFRHKRTDEEQKVLEFQYGARSCISNYEEAYKELRECQTYFPESGYPTREGEIHQLGKAIYSYLCTEAKQVYKNGFEITFNSLFSDRTKFICINKERFNPINFGIDYHSDGYDGVASFYYDGSAKLWRYSLYNDNGKVDCSAIAKQFGGGGHKGASGFILNNDEFFKLIIK